MYTHFKLNCENFSLQLIDSQVNSTLIKNPDTKVEASFGRLARSSMRNLPHVERPVLLAALWVNAQNVVSRRQNATPRLPCLFAFQRTQSRFDSLPLKNNA